MTRCISRQAPRRNTSLTVLLGLLLSLSCALLMAPAGASAAQAGSLSMTSEEGDYIGGGQTYSYDTSAGDAFGSSTPQQAVTVNVQAANGDWWFLSFAAAQGEALTVGTYDGAARYPFQAPDEPGLEVFGNGRGCNTLTGTFTVTEITYGIDEEGEVQLQSFDADFEQHCEGAAPALRGHVNIGSGPPAPPLTIALALSARGVVDRAGAIATVGGTVTCNRPTTVFLSGTLAQGAGRPAARGRFDRQIACSGVTPWEATVRSDSRVAFKPGAARLSADASAYDPEHERTVTDTRTATVRLKR